MICCSNNTPFIIVQRQHLRLFVLTFVLSSSSLPFIKAFVPAFVFPPSSSISVWLRTKVEDGLKVLTKMGIELAGCFLRMGAHSGKHRYAVGA